MPMHARATKGILRIWVAAKELKFKYHIVGIYLYIYSGSHKGSNSCKKMVLLGSMVLHLTSLVPYNNSNNNSNTNSNINGKGSNNNRH